MAREATIVQTVRRVFKWGRSGLIKVALVFTPSGEPVKLVKTHVEAKPDIIEGYWEWRLGTGSYAIIRLYRRSLRRYFKVSVKCINIDNNGGRIIAVRRFTVKGFNYEALVEWARGICP
jgi:hypothetical protein